MLSGNVLIFLFKAGKHFRCLLIHFIMIFPMKPPQIHNLSISISTWVHFAKQWQAVLQIYAQKSFLCCDSIITVIAGCHNKNKVFVVKTLKISHAFNEILIFLYFCMFSYPRRWGDSSHSLKIIFLGTSKRFVCRMCCCSGGRSPREGSGKQPWTSIPGKLLGRETQGLEGKLISSIIFTLKHLISVKPINKQSKQHQLLLPRVVSCMYF